MNGDVPHAAGMPRTQARGQPTTYYLQHHFEGPARLTTTLVHAISDVAGVDMTDAEATLYDQVDPDALDALFSRPSHNPGQVALSLTLWGYQVTVYGDGQIAITVPRQ